LAKNPDVAVFPISPSLVPFAQDTVDRLAYLFPNITFALTKDGIQISSDCILDVPMISQEIYYGLARQKIRAEGQQVRASLYAALFQ
jgi:hypothetical protein